MDNTLRILVVDDHRDSADLISITLRRASPAYSEVTAGSFEEALTAAMANHFDLLLSDIGLPDRDGCDLLQQIRMIYPIPAIAVTGFAMPDELQHDRDAGFNECLVKPFEIDKLLDAVQRNTKAS